MGPSTGEGEAEPEAGGSGGDTHLAPRWERGLRPRACRTGLLWTEDRSRHCLFYKSD